MTEYYHFSTISEIIYLSNNQSGFWRASGSFPMERSGWQHLNPPLSLSLKKYLFIYFVLKFMSAESVLPSNRLILCRPLLLPPSIFPSIRAEEEEGDREWDGWMTSPTQWTWVWTNSGRWWRTGKLGLLQSIRSQRVRHDLATEQHNLIISA